MTKPDRYALQDKEDLPHAIRILKVWAKDLPVGYQIVINVVDITKETIERVPLSQRKTKKR